MERQPERVRVAEIKPKPSNVSWQLARIRSGCFIHRGVVVFGGPCDCELPQLSALTGGRVPLALPLAPPPR